MNRSELIKGITHYLTHLRMQVEHLNGLNLQDDNIHAENFFRDFLNLVLGCDLKNINIVEKNAQAVDLGDEVGRMAIQVTSTSEIGKIRHTCEGFLKRGLDCKYDRLVVLIVGEKKKYREISIGDDDGFNISLEDDVWGMIELIRQVGDLPLDKLSQCLDFLRSELRIVEPRVSNEVETLIRLIEVLSAAEEGLAFGDNRDDPDPERKIHDRFAEHAEFLQRLYVDLYEIYARTLDDVKKHSELSHVRVLKLQVYLMRWSDRVLNDCGGDPTLALDVLTGKVLDMMGNSDLSYDDGAVRFYLIEQLVACNVFPNKRSVNA